MLTTCVLYKNGRTHRQQRGSRCLRRLFLYFELPLSAPRALASTATNRDCDPTTRWRKREEGGREREGEEGRGGRRREGRGRRERREGRGRREGEEGGEGEGEERVKEERVGKEREKTKGNVWRKAVELIQEEKLKTQCSWYTCSRTSTSDERLIVTLVNSYSRYKR